MGIPGVYYWPNYNIADAAIVTGVIGLGVYVVVDDIRNQRRAKQHAMTAAPESTPVE
jgi:signal peptidase II